MSHIALLGMLNGLLASAAGVAALVFFKAYTTTCDRLFLLFGSAFMLLGIERLLMPLDLFGAEHQWWLYGIRLVAFLVIIVAIVDKNRVGEPRHGSLPR